MKAVDIKELLKQMGYGFGFVNPFTTEYARDPKHYYRNAWDCFEKMLALDGELAAIDNLYRLAVLSHDTTVEPADDAPESQKAAEFVRAVIARITDWNEVRYAMLDARAKGLALACIGPEGWDTEIDGKLAPKSIQVFPQHWFKFMPVGDDPARLVWAGTGQFDLDVEEPGRWVIARFGATLENPYGFGYLRKAFLPFVIKNVLSQYMHEGFEFAVDPEKWAETADAEAWAQKDDILAALEGMARRSVTVMPPGARVNIIDTGGGSIDKQLTVIRYYAELQAKIVLGQTLTTDVGRTGSYELGKIHELQQARLVIDGCRDEERYWNKQFIEPLCAVNFGVGRAKWRNLYEPQRDVAGFVDALDTLGNRYDIPLIREWAYKLLDIPIPPEEAEVGEESEVPILVPKAPQASPFGEATATAHTRKAPRVAKAGGTLRPRQTVAAERARLLNGQIKTNLQLSRAAVEGRLSFFGK